MQRTKVPRTPSTRRVAGVALIANFSLHVITGVAAVAVHYSILYAMLQLGLSPLLASGIGFCGGAVARFALSYWRVFEPSRGLTIAGRRFVVALIAQAIANTLLLALLLRAGLDLWPAQVTTTIAMTFFNYAGYRLWVFR